MSIKDLELILKKDPIIATFSTNDLKTSPKRVYNDYMVHAKTHLSLGDTATFVDTIFKWVSGVNQGAFIGAVLGDYGEGKTSFQVHVWEQSFGRKVLAIPPFQWSKFEDIVEAVANWVIYILESDRPDLASKVDSQYEKFKSTTIESLANDLSSQNGIDFDTAYKTIEAGLTDGIIQLTGLSATRVLDFLKLLSDIVIEAGFVGLLVLLDEPEVAAKHLGNEPVQGFIFELADILHQRKGNYGVFLSMPQNFYASCAQKFHSLPARLQARHCFPVLSDIFGVTFAVDLWNRYIEKFDLGKDGKKIVDAWALKAIGQIGSADCRHLSYGPRSVVSAFNSMVSHYLKNSTSYKTKDLLSDIQKQEIMIRPEYRSILTGVLNSLDVTDENREAVEFMAVFPLGLRKTDLKQLDYEPLLRPLTAGGGLVQVTAQTMGLRKLRFQDGPQQGDILEEMIQEFDSEYAPGIRAQKRALQVFVDHIIPELFPKRKGASLIGWTDEEKIKDLESGKLFFGVKVGAFDEMSKTFPSRAAMIAVGTDNVGFSKIKIPVIDLGSGPTTYDLLFIFILNSTEFDNQEKNTSVNVRIITNKSGEKLIEFAINLDLVNCLLTDDFLANLVGEDRITPMWLLGLIGQLSKQSFPMEYQNIWDVKKQDIIRDLKKCFFGMTFSNQLKDILKSKFNMTIMEAGLGLLDKATTLMLAEKYPEYSTLIRQSQWNQRVKDYIAALQNENIPLECKRGKKVWNATSSELSTAFHTSIMNISGGAFDNFDNLVRIKSPGRDQPREVQFFLHPFEQGIYDFINSEINTDRIKVNNIDCPYVSVRVQLLDWLKKYGYTVEELRNIIEIGLARKTFEKTDRQGEELLYCRPLDINGIKENLKTKLDSFEEEVEQMRKISWYSLNYDFERAYADVDKIKADTDYDGLNRLIEGFKYQHNNQIFAFSSRFEDEINQKIITPLLSSRKGLNEDRRIASLKVVEAKSVWVAKLNELIIPNFQQRLNNIKAEYNEIKQKSEQLKGDVSRISSSTQHEKINQYVEAYDEYMLLTASWDETYDGAMHFFQELKYFDDWLKLKNQSDEVYTRLIELKNDEAHKNKAEDLLVEFGSVSDSIEDHLQLMNVDGLKDVQRFGELINAIDKSRQDYLQGLRLEFINQKNDFNELFTKIKIEPLKNVFDQSNIKQSYDTLYQEAVDKVRNECLGTIRTEFYTRQMDILYATNILNTIDKDLAEKEIDQIERFNKALSELDKKLSVDWLKEILEVESSNIIDFVNKAYLLSDKLYRMIMDATRPKKLEDKSLVDLYKQIEKHSEVDLKDLILYMSRKISDPKVALEETLASLSELFKSNNVEINVKYRKR